MVTNSMIRISPFFRIHLLVLCGVVLLAFWDPAAGLHAQSAASSGASSPDPSSTDIDAPTPQIAPAIAPQPPEAPIKTTSSPEAVPPDSGAPGAPRDHRRQARQLTGTGQQQQTQNSGGAHFSLWDRTPFDAYLPGGSARSGQQVSSGAGENTQNSSFQGGNGACFDCALGAGTMSSNTMGNRSAWLMGQPGQLNQPNFGQFLRASAGMNLSSSFGGFRMSYGDKLNGNAGGPGSVGKGAAQATFNSSSFGGAFNFSAAAMMGSSGMHGAFSSGVIGSNSFSNPSSFGGAPMGAGSEKRPATSLTTRMSF